jgi:hypothetical protein
MASPVELIASTASLHHAKPEILAASAEVTQRIPGVDSAFAAAIVPGAVSLLRQAVAAPPPACCRPPSGSIAS